MNQSKAVMIKEDGDGKVRSQMVSYSAPLPPASEFEKYERVLKGSANRIIRLAENQNKHRRFIETIVVITDSIRSIGGFIAALIIVLAGMCAGVYLIMNNKSTQGIVAILVPLATIIGAFVYQQKGKSKEQH